MQTKLSLVHRTKWKGWRAKQVPSLGRISSHLSRFTRVYTVPFRRLGVDLQSLTNWPFAMSCSLCRQRTRRMQLKKSVRRRSAMPWLLLILAWLRPILNAAVLLERDSLEGKKRMGKYASQRDGEPEEWAVIAVCEETPKSFGSGCCQDCCSTNLTVQCVFNVWPFDRCLLIESWGCFFCSVVPRKRTVLLMVGMSMLPLIFACFRRAFPKKPSLADVMSRRTELHSKVSTNVTISSNLPASQCNLLQTARSHLDVPLIKWSSKRSVLLSFPFKVVSDVHTTTTLHWCCPQYNN